MSNSSTYILPSASSSSASSSSSGASVLSSASASVDVVYDLSRLLQCGFDKSTVALLVGLCECGVQPEALATVVKELRREARAQPAQRANGSGSSG